MRILNRIDFQCSCFYKYFKAYYSTCKLTNFKYSPYCKLYKNGSPIGDLYSKDIVRENELCLSRNWSLNVKSLNVFIDYLA